MFARRIVLVAALATAAACSSITTVRVQPEHVFVGSHLRPIAVIHAQVTSAYLLWIPIPGHVDLDYVVNRMLLGTAKMLGADKVHAVKAENALYTGISPLRNRFGCRSAPASGVAVTIDQETASAAKASP